MGREYIKDATGRMIAQIELQANGDKVVRDFYGRMLGKYDHATDTTKDFYGRVVAKGDCVGLLIK